MLVALQRPRHDHSIRDGRFKQFSCTRSAPFFANPRGMLVHRVRSLYRLTFDGSRREPWWLVDYWCENGCNSVGSDPDDALLFDPGDKLVCARCEALAVAKQQKTSSELAGRHVCIGVCRPVNVCPQHADHQPKDDP